MIFEVNCTLAGVEVRGNDEEYLFKTKLFSHSSVLLDQNSNIIVSLTRSSWWRMNFNLVENQRRYKLKQRFLETELIENGSNTRFHLSGSGFYRQSLPVTKVIGKNLRARKYEIEINEKNHWLALLAVTCLECSVVANGG